MSKSELSLKTQVLVTGVYVTTELAATVREWCIANPEKMFAVDWIHPDGTIGYIDNMITRMSVDEVKKGLMALATVFPTLDLGVSVMSGEAGSYNFPVIGYRVKSGRVIQDSMPHSGHKPPKRLK